MNDIITEMFRPNVYKVGRQPITTNPLLFDFGTVYIEIYVAFSLITI